MPLLLEADAATAGLFDAALGPDAETLRTPEELMARLRRRSHHAVVIGPSLDLVGALTIAEQVRAANPATSVLLARSSLSPEIYAWAMDSGVSAVVETEDDEALVVALSRARQTWESIHGASELGGRTAGYVVTVFSPKGGVGKTTMSVNIALALAATGSRVCLIDLDLAFGDVAITLQLIPQNTLADAAGMEERLDWSMLRGLLAEHRSGLQVLAAPTNPEGRERITPALVRQVITELRERFDHVVVDTPPGFDDQVLGAFDETDEIVIVATLDVPTIKNVKVAIETLDLLHLVPGHRHLVLNRADQEVGLTAANVEDLLGVKVDVTLPSAIAVACATNSGDPIVASSPQHPVSLALAGFVRRLPGVASVATAVPDAARRGGLFSRRRKELVR